MHTYLHVSKSSASSSRRTWWKAGFGVGMLDERTCYNFFFGGTLLRTQHTTCCWLMHSTYAPMLKLGWSQLHQSKVCTCRLTPHCQVKMLSQHWYRYQHASRCCRKGAQLQDLCHVPSQGRTNITILAIQYVDFQITNQSSCLVSPPGRESTLKLKVTVVVVQLANVYDVLLLLPDEGSSRSSQRTVGVSYPTVLVVPRPHRSKTTVANCGLLVWNGCSTIYWTTWKCNWWVRKARPAYHSEKNFEDSLLEANYVILIKIEREVTVVIKIEFSKVRKHH